MPTSPPRISVCIPAYNEERNVGRLLKHLVRRQLKFGTISEILVETSGSTDGTVAVVEAVSREHPTVRALEGPMRAGVAGALNRLFREARGDVIARVDADVAPGSGALDLMVACLADPEVGIVGPRIVPSPTGTAWVDRMARTEYLLHHLVSLSAPKTTVLQVFRKLPMALPDEAEAEDMLIQSLVESHGYRACYEPRARVWVMPPRTFREFLQQRIRNITAQGWVMRHSGNAAPTQSARFVLGALIDGIRSRTIDPRGLVEFLSVEMAAQLTARARDAALGHASQAVYDPLPSTKNPVWVEL